MKRYLAPLLALSLVGGSALAQDNSALLDLLVKKKVITEKDADQVRTELDHQQADNSLNKLKLADSVTQMAIGGDLRLRYQYNRLDHQAFVANNADQQSRWRYRLRLNADFQLGPSFFGGVTLATGQGSDSNNQTFDNGFANSSIYINRAFIGWNAADWLTVIAGKQDNPFYTTDLVWDPDTRPVSLTEVLKIDKFFGAGETTSTVTDKDGKDIVTSKPAEPKWTLSLISAQMYYSDNNEFNFDNDSANDAYIFAEQILYTQKIGPAKLTFAPGVYFYNSASLTGFNNNTSFQDAATVSGATRKLTILTAPGDISFKLGKLPTKFYWDFAYNTQGRDRANEVYRTQETQSNLKTHSSHTFQDDVAWLAGLQFGQNKKAGDLSFLVNYRQTGLTSVDPNLNDSDFALGQLNTQGFKTQLTYNVSDSLTVAAIYMYAFNLRDSLGNGALTSVDNQTTLNQRVADGNNIQVFEFDVQLKF